MSEYEHPENGEYGFREIDGLSSVFNAFKKPERIITYDLIAQGYSLPEVKEVVPVSGSTVHNYENDFENLGLVEETSETGVYELTERGEIVRGAIQDFEEVYREALLETGMEEAFELLDIDQDSEEAEDIEELLKNTDDLGSLPF